MAKSDFQTILELSQQLQEVAGRMIENQKLSPVKGRAPKKKAAEAISRFKLKINKKILK